MSSILPTLSPEIVELLSTFLPLADLRSFRCVCRAINKKTLRRFALTHFTTMQTDLSRSSLQRLRGISDVEQLASRVQCLRIVHSEDDGRLGKGLNWSRDQWCNLEDRAEGFGLLRTTLFDKLLNCRSIRIDSYDEYDPLRETNSLIPSQVVGLILSLVAAGLALTSFAIVSSYDGSGRLDMKGLQMYLSYTSPFITAWSQIEELSLDYGMTADQLDWALHLVSSAPRLRSLSLGFHEASSSFMEELSSLCSLQQLESLSIRAAHMTVGSISTLLLQNCETLRSLSLQHTCIDRGTWAVLLDVIKNQMPHLKDLYLFWLKEQLPNRRVNFSTMTRYPVVPGSEDRRTGDHRLRFDSHKLDLVENPIRLRYWGIVRQSVVGVEYHGAGVEHVLSALAEAAAIISV